MFDGEFNYQHLKTMDSVNCLSRSSHLLSEISKISFWKVIYGDLRNLRKSNWRMKTVTQLDVISKIAFFAHHAKFNSPVQRRLCCTTMALQKFKWNLFYLWETMTKFRKSTLNLNSGFVIRYLLPYQIIVE